MGLKHVKSSSDSKGELGIRVFRNGKEVRADAGEGSSALAGLAVIIAVAVISFCAGTLIS